VKVLFHRKGAKVAKEAQREETAAGLGGNRNRKSFIAVLLLFLP